MLFIGKLLPALEVRMVMHILLLLGALV